MGNCSKYLLDILPEDGHAICVQINIYDDDSIRVTEYLLEFTQNSYSCRMFIGVWVEKIYRPLIVDRPISMVLYLIP